LRSRFIVKYIFENNKLGCRENAASVKGRISVLPKAKGAMET
jgi:hypothetical protein